MQTLIQRSPVPLTTQCIRTECSYHKKNIKEIYCVRLEIKPSDHSRDHSTDYSKNNGDLIPWNHVHIEAPPPPPLERDIHLGITPRS